MRFKKSQSALEFMLILLFVFIIISMIMYVVGIMTVDLNKKERQSDVDNFAKSILSEFDLVQKVEGGYTREFLISQSLNFEFNFSIINSSYLKVVDLRNRNPENVYAGVYYYPINGNFTEKIVSKNIGGVNETYIIIKKKFVNNYQGIKLIN